ncbi:MAG: hypothetical protein KBT34_10455 [Prevotella sp.]|nr:hypothetical protein [Candidatus Prevotella equi]
MATRQQRRFKNYAQLHRQYERVYGQAKNDGERQRATDAFNRSMYQYAKQDMFRFSNGMTNAQATSYARSHGLSMGTSAG